jgi:23S rRNA G2069 N7-methylase RlmK/C1962 C5-methylase RlmI
MPYVVQSQGGALEGKRVLDIACNSGFWSIQCALLGATS